MNYVHNKEGYRFCDCLPKVGIRIIVDGRRNGVRERIEEPTRQLALAVKKIIESNLKHASGEPIEAVISSISIGGVSEGVKVSEEFRKLNVGAVISITKAWAYAAEVIEMDKTIPQAIWGFNGSERPGAVYLAGAIATSEQKGIPIFKIYGRDVQDADENSVPEDVEEQILHFVRCAVAVATMKNKSYLSMGSVCMGIGGSIVIPELFQDYLNMRNEYIDMTEFTRRIERKIYDEREYDRAVEWVKENCIECADPNPSEKQLSEEDKIANWEFVIKMCLIAKDLMVGNNELAKLGYREEAEGHNAILAGFQGQRQWTDHFPNGDFMEAMLNSSFDWNGTRQPYIVTTENDSLNGLSMLFGHLLTGTAQIFADVRTYWSAEAIKRVSNIDILPDNLNEGFIYLTNSGAAALDGTGRMKDNNGNNTIKPHYDITDADAKACIDATRWGAGKLATFRGGGFSSAYETQGGLPMTMIRLNYIKGQGPVIQLAEGYSIDIDNKIKGIIVERTDPTWPKTFFKPVLNGKGAFRDTYTVMKKWSSNHCAISYGHIGDRIITLASMLRIPVSMHNVSPERIIRPSAWDSFGNENLESSDYRACSNFGPLYD